MRAVPTIEEPVPVLDLTRKAIEKLTEEVRTLGLVSPPPTRRPYAST
jgi:hypothetical protein